MSARTYFRTAFVLTLAGVLFAGYLSFKKLLTGICAFNEPCPYFLGHPSCWYGFGLFVLLFIITIVAMAGGIKLKTAKNWLLTISLIGVIFAGYFVVAEIATWLARGHMIYYSLGLPTCAYGLIFYIAIFVVSLLVRPSQDSGQIN